MGVGSIALSVSKTSHIESERRNAAAGVGPTKLNVTRKSSLVRLTSGTSFGPEFGAGGTSASTTDFAWGAAVDGSAACGATAGAATTFSAGAGAVWDFS